MVDKAAARPVPPRFQPRKRGAEGGGVKPVARPGPGRQEFDAGAGRTGSDQAAGGDEKMGHGVARVPAYQLL